jgi:hypothetical protein
MDKKKIRTLDDVLSLYNKKTIPSYSDLVNEDKQNETQNAIAKQESRRKPRNQKKEKNVILEQIYEVEEKKKKGKKKKVSKPIQLKSITLNDDDYNEEEENDQENKITFTKTFR